LDSKRAHALSCSQLADWRLDGRKSGQPEPKLGIPIYDSVAVTLWKCLEIGGVAPSSVRGWGHLFAVLGSDPM